MFIKAISLQNYRNYSSLNLDFDPKTNIFYGDNAQGKTNILEAVYVSGTTRSHKNAKDRELILFGEEEAHICTLLEKRGGVGGQTDRVYETVCDKNIEKSVGRG